MRRESVYIEIGKILNVKLDYLTKFQQNLCKIFNIIPESRYDSYLEITNSEYIYLVLGDVFLSESGEEFIVLYKDGKPYLKTLKWRAIPMDEDKELTLFSKQFHSLVENL